MKTSALLALIVCVFGLAGLSHASQMIASPAIFFAPTQVLAACYIRNIGTTQVSVGVSIFDEAGNTLPGVSSCAVPLAAGASCYVIVYIGTEAAYACSATTSGKAKNLRGIFTLEHSHPARSAPLR